MKKPTFVDTDEKDMSFLSSMLKQLKLVWLLFRDSRISALTKSVLPLSLLYLVSPVDFIPDFVLGLGQLDDFGIILLGMTLFVKLCPPNIVQEYLRQLEYGNDFYIDNDETVDAAYRVVDEE
ncbi:MAG: DUF1232 domain-containing protein [Anaerolineae bacterium]|nr:DUF1232 domain-containing protein [Anaerolineae bacterium]